MTDRQILDRDEIDRIVKEQQARSQWLIDRKVEIRPDDEGTFDELVLYDKPDGDCIVHAEMMKRRVVMWIRSTKGKLDVRAEED
jgi:hypothetical protein